MWTIKGRIRYLISEMDGRMAPVPRPWIRFAEVQRESRYENGNTTTTNLSISLDIKGYTSKVGHKLQ